MTRNAVLTIVLLLRMYNVAVAGILCRRSSAVPLKWLSSYSAAEAMWLLQGNIVYSLQKQPGYFHTIGLTSYIVAVQLGYRVAGNMTVLVCMLQIITSKIFLTIPHG